MKSLSAYPVLYKSYIYLLPEIPVQIIFTYSSRVIERNITVSVLLISLYGFMTLIVSEV